MGNEIISALIGVTFYLVLVFGYLSYFIEKNSLNEYKEKALKKGILITETEPLKRRNKILK